MVTRKPLPENSTIRRKLVPSSQALEANQPTSQDAHDEDTEQFEHVDADRLLPEDVPDLLRPGSRQSASQSSLEEENIWVDTAGTMPTAEGSGSLAPVPSVLRPRPASIQSRAETNPFLKRKLSGNSASSSQDVVGIVSELPAQPPPPVPPIPSLSNLSLAEPSNNPWQPALDEKKSGAATPAAVELPDNNLDDSSIWDSRAPSRKLSPAPPFVRPPLVALPSDEASTPWSEEGKSKAPEPLIPVTGVVEDEFSEESHVWDEIAKPEKGKAPATLQGHSAPEADWDTLDDELRPQSKQSSGEFVDAPEKQPVNSLAAASSSEEPPALPPRTSTEQAPPPPPRPPPNAKAETYQIKKVNWFDSKAVENPRTSPILVQNANGPCPLVALVNALILTTPAEVRDTALVETLRSREQVSLGLLLDAVFDELMSPRRTREDSELPDVGELYEFLKGLHTGMNVNPRFVPTAETERLFKRTSLTHLHPSERQDLIPGTFEDTREMALYSAFSIPLIHGWLPRKDEVVYDALRRRAVSYEDAQNLLSREEELENELSSTRHEGLSEEEQEVYQDILTVKSFLSISATQLTPWGLEVITRAMNPGSVAILFRNDHFATLYRHPQTLELLTLVTDAGYATHDEIVWESLIDVNGERAEFFSGDFLLVGGAHQQPGATDGLAGRQNQWPPEQASGGNESGWTTVQGRNSRNQAQAPTDEPPMSPIHEQEDRDLALALQLQEEEEQQHRTEQERRRRESMLSEQYIEQQAQQSPAGARGGRAGAATAARGRGRGAPSLTPGRRTSSIQANSGLTTTTTASSASSATSAGRGRGAGAQPAAVRPLVPPAAAGTRTETRRPADDGLDDAPPSYEHAAKQTPYVPPEGHPNHPASSPSPLGGGVAGPSGAGSPRFANAPTGRRVPTGPAGMPPAGVPPMARMRPGVPPTATAGNGNNRDKDCVVM